MSEEIKNETQTNIDETNTTDESKKPEEQNVENKQIPYDRFKQKVDEANALKEKLAEIEKEQAEKERKELEEKENYKALYEQVLEQIEETKSKALSAKKETALKIAGYDDEQVDLLSKLIEGESDEEIGASVEQIKAKFPIKDDYADPSPFNGTKEKPTIVGAEEQAKSIYERIKNKIR